MNKFISEEEWTYLVMKKRFGIPLGSCWGAFEITCENCNTEFRNIKPSGTRGYTCPNCGHRNHKMTFILDPQTDGSFLCPR